MTNDVQFLPFCLGLFYLLLFLLTMCIGCTKDKESKSKQIVKIEIKPKLTNNTNSETFNQAKDVLKSIGFSVTEAKKMLNSVEPCDDVQQWVKNSLERLKI